MILTLLTLTLTLTRVKIENPPEHEPYKGSASPLQYYASATLYDLFYVAQALSRVGVGRLRELLVSSTLTLP